MHVNYISIYKGKYFATGTRQAKANVPATSGFYCLTFRTVQVACEIEGSPPEARNDKPCG